MLRISEELSPSNSIKNGSELLKVILNLEIFEELAQYNEDMEESEGDDNQFVPDSLDDSSFLSNS
jgi:hypothetical protein